MPVTTYRDIGILTCGGEVSYDNFDVGYADPTFNLTPAYTQVWHMYMEHGEAITFTIDIRIHQPTTNFNNNTEAIWFVTFLGINLSGTPGGDHGDFTASSTVTYYNSSANNSEVADDGTRYRPGRWFRFEEWNTFGAMEFHCRAVSCVKLPVGPGHVTVPGPALSTSTLSSGEGGWNVGQA